MRVVVGGSNQRMQKPLLFESDSGKLSISVRPNPELLQTCFLGAMLTKVCEGLVETSLKTENYETAERSRENNGSKDETGTRLHGKKERSK